MGATCESENLNPPIRQRENSLGQQILVMADSLMVVLQDLNLTLHRYRDENSKLSNLMRLASAETRRRKAEDCLNYTYYSANVSTS